MATVSLKDKWGMSYPGDERREECSRYQDGLGKGRGAWCIEGTCNILVWLTSKKQECRPREVRGHEVKGQQCMIWETAMQGLREVYLSLEGTPIARLWSAQLRNHSSTTRQIWMIRAQGVYRKTQLKCQFLGEDFLDHPNFHENQGILYSPTSGIPKALRRARLLMRLCMLSQSIVSNFLRPHGL